MRITGTTAQGLRLPIISPGDNLIDIIVDHVLTATAHHPLQSDDIIGVTEGIVAKAEQNFASIDHIATHIAEIFPQDTTESVALVFPMFSRNRFFNILKGIAKGVKHLHVILPFPYDEVGNPIIDVRNPANFTIVEDIGKALTSVTNFVARSQGPHKHEFTGVDYLELYQSAGDNITLHLTCDPSQAFTLTEHIIVGEIHKKDLTAAKLKAKNPAAKVITLSDILNKPINGSGFNKKYGVLGSNLSTGTTLKLFPDKSQEFVEEVQARLQKATGAAPEVMVFGDGAFKDPTQGIWELADPVVSPGYTPRLGQSPDEIKLKFVSDNDFAHLSGEEKTAAIKAAIANKKDNTAFREGTTPRIFADLVGSLCDLISGSGDKGTPVVLIRGYFDDLSVD